MMPAKSHNGYYREDSLPSPLPVVMVLTKGVLVLVGLVLGLHYGDSHTLESQLSGRIPRGQNVSQYAMSDTKKGGVPILAPKGPR